MTTDDGEGSRARPRRWDFREVNVLVLVTLAAITGAVALAGWWYRPGASAYPSVPRGLELNVQANVRSLALVVTRTRTGATVLTLYDDDRDQLGAAGHGVTRPQGWSVGIDGLGSGRVVRRPAGAAMPIPPGDSPMDHTFMEVPSVHRLPSVRIPDVGHVPAERYAPVDPGAALYLQVRWDHDAPVQLDGSYLSGQLPGLALSWPGTAPATVPLRVSLDPAAGDVGDFSLQASVYPSVTAEHSWIWYRESDVRAQAGYLGGRAVVYPVALSAVNVSATQEESVRTFFSGVLLGIAGGAVLGVVLELLKIRRVRPAG